MKHDEMVELAMREQFTDEEWSERKLHIQTLRNFNTSSLLAAEALSVIRDKKLYLPHATLKEFCERECGWSKQRAYQLISFFKVRSLLPPKSQHLVDSERVARELKKVPEVKRVEILDDAKRFHSKGGKITAKSIKLSEKSINYETKSKSITDGDSASDAGFGTDINGNSIPIAAAPYWNRKDEAKEILGKISKARTAIKELAPDDPMWAGINLNGVIADLNAAYNRFAPSVPAHVCPMCHGTKPDNCECCKGKGVLSEYFYRMVPENMKPEMPF